jgi:HSP20 family molecular chaperone IbpA
MSLFHRDPFFNDIFGSNLGPSLGFRQTSTQAHHHLHETENEVTLSIDVPGVKSNDLQVQFEDNVLRISGERKTAGSESKFVRSFAMDPTNVDVDNMKANLDCGVLTLTVPKHHEACSQEDNYSDRNSLGSDPSTCPHHHKLLKCRRDK